MAAKQGREKDSIDYAIFFTAPLGCSMLSFSRPRLAAGVVILGDEH